MTCKIKLKNANQHVVLDKFVYEWLITDPELFMFDISEHLFLHSSGNRAVFQKTVRVAKREYKYLQIYIHTLIAEKYLIHTKTAEKSYVGAKDSNLLNCRVSNLCYQQLGVTMRKTKGHSKTGFKGVHKAWHRYKAVIYLNGKYLHIGYFDTPREAAIAFNEKAKEIFGEENCRLNKIPLAEPLEANINIKKRKPYTRRNGNQSAGIGIVEGAGRFQGGQARGTAVA